MNRKELSSNNQKNNDKGVFNRVTFNGKDFVLDNVINHAKESLLELQTDIESIIFNGDREKAKSEIMKRNKQTNIQGRRGAVKNLLGNAINKSPNLVNKIMELQNNNLINQRKTKIDNLQNKKFSLMSSTSSKFNLQNSIINLEDNTNRKSLPYMDSTNSKNSNQNLKVNFRMTLNNLSKLNLSNNFERSRFNSHMKNKLKLANSNSYSEQYFHETYNKPSQKVKKGNFEDNYEENKNVAFNHLNEKKTIIKNSQNDIENNFNSNKNKINNNLLTTKSAALSQSRNARVSPKTYPLYSFNSNTMLNIREKENKKESNNICRNNDNMNNDNSNKNDNFSSSYNEALQTTHYKSAFNSTFNFNPNSTNNITSSIFRPTQLNLGSIAAGASVQNINDSISNTTDSDLTSNSSFYNRINNNSYLNKNFKNANSFNNENNCSDFKLNNDNLYNKNTNLNSNNNIVNPRKTLSLFSRPSLQNLKPNLEETEGISNCDKIRERNSISQLHSLKSKQKSINDKNHKKENQNQNNNLTISLNNLNFNKTFHSNFHHNSYSNKNNINNFNNITPNPNFNQSDSNKDFFSTQVIDLKSTVGKKRLLPHLIQGFKSIENEMTDIKSNLSKAIKSLDDSIEHSEKNKLKKNREFAEETENMNDVFLYGNNGQGYYMSNQKVMKEASILKSMKSENIFKHKRFFDQRFDLISKDKEEFIDNGLSKGTESKFKKVQEYLVDTEDMKKRAIKNIEMHQLKVRMEALNENSDEDTGDDINFYGEKSSQ